MSRPRVQVLFGCCDALSAHAGERFVVAWVGEDDPASAGLVLVNVARHPCVVVVADASAEEVGRDPACLLQVVGDVEDSVDAGEAFLLSAVVSPDNVTAQGNLREEKRRQRFGRHLPALLVEAGFSRQCR